MELAGTVKCLLCRGRQPFDKRSFDEMEMHLKSQHRVIFFMKELIQHTKDAKNKEELLANQTIDVDIEVKQEDQDDIVVEYEHLSTNEGGDSILVEDDDIPTSEPEHSMDSLIEADGFGNKILEDIPVATAQDLGGIPTCVNEPENYNANETAINFNPATVGTISEEATADVALSCDLNNAGAEFDENLVQLNTTLPIVGERSEDLTELLMKQSNEISEPRSNEIIEQSSNVIIAPSSNGIIEPSLNAIIEPSSNAIIEPRPNEMNNSCNFNDQLTLNSSVEALIDNLMSTESFIRGMNWIVQTGSTNMGDYRDASLLHYNGEKSTASNSSDVTVNTQEGDNTFNDDCDEIPTSNDNTVSVLDKLDAFVDTPTRIMEIIHKPSETVDTTVLPPTDIKASLEISESSVKLSSNLCESPQKSKGWYDLVPRENVQVSSKKQNGSSDISTNNRKRRMFFDKAQNESKKKFKSSLDSVSFYKNDKKDKSLNDRKNFKCEQCNMMYASKQTLKNHVCKGDLLKFKIKKCRVDLYTVSYKKNAIAQKECNGINHKVSHDRTYKDSHGINHKESHSITHKESHTITQKESHSITHKSGPSDIMEEERKLGGEPFLGEAMLKQDNKNKGKTFICDGCGKHFSSEHGKKVHKMKMHS